MGLIAWDKVNGYLHTRLGTSSVYYIYMALMIVMEISIAAMMDGIEDTPKVKPRNPMANFINARQHLA